MRNKVAKAAVKNVRHLHKKYDIQYEFVFARQVEDKIGRTL